MSEVQFLQVKSDTGSMIFVSGSIASTANTVIISYTPANGVTFVFIEGVVVSHAAASAETGGVCEVRNNTFVRDYLLCLSGNNNGATNIYSTLSMPKSTKKGDVLIGNGTLTYDLFQVTTEGTGTVYGAIQGYLE